MINFIQQASTALNTVAATDYSNSNRAKTSMMRIVACRNDSDNDSHSNIEVQYRPCGAHNSICTVCLQSILIHSIAQHCKHAETVCDSHGSAQLVAQAHKHDAQVAPS